MSNLFTICHGCASCQAQPKNGGCWGPCACLADPQKRDIIELVQIGHCPLNKFAGRQGIDAIGRLASDGLQPTDPWKERGPEFWGDLHRWALTGDISEPGVWLGKFREKLRLASQNCSCLAKWDALCAKYPVPLDHEGIFVWTVDRHNDVNLDLAKATMTVDEARKRWGPQIQK